MLIAFSVKNFRSIKDEQIFNLNASADKSNKWNTISWKKTKILKSSVIYGSNASGKTNIITALARLLRTMGSDGIVSKQDPYNVMRLFEPFMLNEKSRQEPSHFKLTFTIGEDNIRYDFYLVIGREGVHEEELFYYPNNRACCLYQRYLKKDGIYEWNYPGGHLKGDKKGIAEKTSNTNLFFTVAATFNHSQLKSVQDWFSATSFMNPNFYYRSFAESCVEKIKSSTHLLKALNLWMKSADLGITQVSWQEKERELPYSSTDKRMFQYRDIEFAFSHFGEKGNKYEITLTNESSGTVKWFQLFFQLYNILENGGVLVVDEISRDLHPLLIRKFIELFHSRDFNTKNAQLIFSTHDATLLDHNLFRRDQIWFAEKDNYGASHYFSLLEYRPRKEEAWMKNYLRGQYGAIPEV